MTNSAALPWETLLSEVSRSSAAHKALVQKGEHAFRAPAHRGGFTVLVHPSTKKRGWWQKTVFDAEGEPVRDSENASWSTLLKNMKLDTPSWKWAEAVAL